MTKSARLNRPVRVRFSAQTYPSSHHGHHQAQGRCFPNWPSLHSSCHVTGFRRGEQRELDSRAECLFSSLSFEKSTSGTRQALEQPGMAAYVGMEWAASSHSSPPCFCSALMALVALACLAPQHHLKHLNRPIQQNISYQLAARANRSPTVSPVHGVSTGMMGLRFRQGVRQTPKVEQHLCPLSDRPPICSDSRATHSCRPPKTALR